MTTCRGMDVSAYQGPQDWAARERDGVSFAFAKASEGLHTRDSRFATHIKGIKAAGLVAGAYHFAWPCQDPRVEAANYVAAVRSFAGRGFTHWLDLERYGDGRNYRGRTNVQIREWAHAWVAAVKAAFPGQRVGVYTSGDDLTRGHYPANADALWYPAYPGAAVDSYAEAERASRPRPSGVAPLIWQFTSRGGDKSIAYLSAAGLREWAGMAAPEPKPAPRYEPFPGAAFFHAGRRSPIIAAMHRRLVEVGCNHYQSSANADVWGPGDVRSYAAWQRKCGYAGAAADGVPGKTSWDRLKVPNS
jgi:GH25 family lysozyme M1 (1,4-beta-N-acetylmuramidase)